MGIGLNPTKADVDAALGTTSRVLAKVLNDLECVKYWIDSKVDADLTTLGYSAGDITALRTLATDAGTLYDIWAGNATLGVAQDFRDSFRPAWGLGDMYATFINTAG